MLKQFMQSISNVHLIDFKAFKEAIACVKDITWCLGYTRDTVGWGTIGSNTNLSLRRLDF